MSSPYHTHAEFEAARLASTEEAFLALPRDELLLSYQANALAECSRHTLLIVEKGRRIGFTWGVLAPLAVRTAASARGQGGMDFLYISYSKDMTREFMDACAMWSKAFAMAITAIDNEYIFEDQDEEGNSRNISASRIQFASGFEIIALPSAPRTIRGKQGVVAIDEAAHLNDLEAVAKAAMALRMWGGRVIIVSTHNGADNPFNEMLNEVRSGKRKGGALTISFNDAIAAGLYERVKLVTNTEFTKEEWIADARGGYTEDQQAEEFDCIPSQGAGSLIPLDKIMACTHDDAGKPELYAGGLVGVGRDVAIRKDLSVIHAVEAVSLVLWLRGALA
ncbi:MAG: terminase family protein [Rhizomicrobium sp.]